MGSVHKMEWWLFKLGSAQGYKNSYPVQLAEYDVANYIQDQPTFEWWVLHTLRKRKFIVKKVKSKYWQITHKYNISIPKSVKEALDIGKEDGNTLWRNGIKKEMPNIDDDVVEHDGDIPELIVYQKISGHLIFYVRISTSYVRESSL